MSLRILSGGAAQGLVQSIASSFEAETGLSITGSFGAVGAMRDKLVAGEPCDLLILTRALIDTLEQTGHVVPASAVPIGRVPTGIAVQSGSAAPDVSDAAALAAALEASDGIYFPDPKLATAGIHFAKVLTALGVDAVADPRLRTFPNGATAMAALSTSDLVSPIGCTQVTEILNTKGVDLVGLLPKEFELSTVYTAAIATRATHAAEARRLIEMALAPEAKVHRDRLGFDPV